MVGLVKTPIRTQTEAAPLQGEQLVVPERLVISPVAGTFRPSAPQTVTTEGEIVDVGQVVGVVHNSGDQIPVHSAFRGFLMGMLASPGERIREGQPVAWLREL